MVQNQGIGIYPSRDQDERKKKPTLRLRHPSHEKALLRDGFLDLPGASALSEELVSLTMSETDGRDRHGDEREAGTVDKAQLDVSRDARAEKINKDPGPQPILTFQRATSKAGELERRSGPGEPETVKRKRREVKRRCFGKSRRSAQHTAASINNINDPFRYHILLLHNVLSRVYYHTKRFSICTNNP